MRSVDPTARQVELLAQLTPAEREIVQSVDLHGRTIAQAAVALGMPAATAEWRYRRAHRRLLAVAFIQPAQPESSELYSKIVPQR